MGVCSKITILPQGAHMPIAPGVLLAPTFSYQLAGSTLRVVIRGEEELSMQSAALGMVRLNAANTWALTGKEPPIAPSALEEAADAEFDATEAAIQSGQYQSRFGIRPLTTVARVFGNAGVSIHCPASCEHCVITQCAHSAHFPFGVFLFRRWRCLCPG